MRIKHRAPLAINLCHCVNQHTGLASSLLADKQIVLPSRSSVDNTVDDGLLIAHYPMLALLLLLAVGEDTRSRAAFASGCELKNWISWREGVLHLL